MIEIITVIIAIVLSVILIESEENIDNKKLHSDLKENNHYVWANIILLPKYYLIAFALLFLLSVIGVITWSSIYAYFYIILVTLTVVCAKIFDYLYE